MSSFLLRLDLPQRQVHLRQRSCSRSRGRGRHHRTCLRCAPQGACSYRPPREAPPQTGCQPGNALRKPDHDEREDNAEHGAPIFSQGLKLILQQRVGQGADNWSEKIGKPAKHGHEDKLPRMGPIDQLGIRQANAKTKNGAAYSAKGGRDDKCGKAKAMHVYAEIFGLAGVVAQRLQMQPERRMHESPHQKTGNHEQAETIVVKGTCKKLDLVVALERKSQNIHARHTHATVTTREMVELEKKRIEQHAKGKSQHAKENAHISRA